jgi:hypothetical protein
MKFALNAISSFGLRVCCTHTHTHTHTSVKKVWRYRPPTGGVSGGYVQNYKFLGSYIPDHIRLDNAFDGAKLTSTIIILTSSKSLNFMQILYKKLHVISTDV